MSVQEVLNLVRQFENLNRYAFAMFILMGVFVIVGLTINVDRHINRKPWIIAQTSCCVLVGLFFCGFIKIGYVQSTIGQQILISSCALHTYFLIYMLCLTSW